MTSFLDMQTDIANRRIPYQSFLQTDSEWVSDPPAVRGEKQWERYNNSNSPHLDWSARTNQHEPRQPYYGGAGLVQKRWTSDTPAQRGEKQWAYYNNANSDNFDYEMDWSTNVWNRRPYKGAAGLAQEDPAPATAAPTLSRPDVPVRGEKEWQQWAADHVEALDH